MKRVLLEQAVGCALGHDITEVDANRQLKMAVFRRGQIVREEDLAHLRRLGRNSLYVLDGTDDGLVHEDDAAIEVAPLAAGDYIAWDPVPVEGKINFRASIDGLFKVDVDRLYQVNALEIPSLPTIHNNLPVAKGKTVAAFRIIPLHCERQVVDAVRAILSTPLFHVKPYCRRKAAVIVTGTEVYEGRIQDAFVPLLRKKAALYGLTIMDTAVLPDDRAQIAATAEEFCSRNDLVFVTGGTSVDPDDVTVAALRDAGVRCDLKGNPLQPGNNLTIGYRGGAAVCAIPAAAIFFSYTSLDVFLPRLMAGERIGKDEILRLAHGGLCHRCPTCHYPICPFGR